MVSKDDSHSMVSKDDSHSMVSKDDSHSMVSKDDSHSMVSKDDSHSMVSKVPASIQMAGTNLFQFNCLPLGLFSPPWIFTKIMRPDCPPHHESLHYLDNNTSLSHTPSVITRDQTSFRTLGHTKIMRLVCHLHLEGLVTTFQAQCPEPF